MVKETPPEAKTGCYTEHHSNNNHNHSHDNDNDFDLESSSSHSSSRVSGLETCRVCQCLESDKRGDTALEFLGIAPPSLDPEKGIKESSFTELVSPDGEDLIIKDEPETDPGSLLELGCSCKNDMALVHYACALKWFVNRGSTICEICGVVAKNVRASDLRKVVCALKEHEALRERGDGGEPSPARIRARQRLSEVSLWFGMINGNNNNNNNNNININNNVVVVSQGVSEQSTSSMNVVTEEEVVTGYQSTVTKWAVEGTGIVIATGLLTVTLAWLIAPRVGKRTARNGLHILLGGICALAIVVFFRFFVLTRIKYGPARFWAILFVFWFLVFGIWASRTHGSHHST